MKGQLPEAKPSRADFPVIGIGASAGGLEAFTTFFDAMAADSGMGFVLVQHLDPTMGSHLAELLAQHTEMKVTEVEDGIRVEPNCVYTILPNRTLSLEKGVLRLREPKEPRGHRKPIDDFFRSLAEDRQEKAICIILSGTGTNGTVGAKAVKAVGGMTMAQDPKTAKYDGMPNSAIDSGEIDYVLSPEKLPEALLKYVGHSYVRNSREKSEAGPPNGLRQLNSILALLRAQFGHEFGNYKKPTLVRRIYRRMGIRHMEEMADYARFLREHPDEVQALSRDLLIPVTSFFRDPEAWKALEEKAIAPLLKNREAHSSIRAWVPAVSSGEEAYCLAMLLAEQAEAVHKQFDIKIFATDVGEDRLNSARGGLFPTAAVSDISSQRLERFFDKEDDSFRIKRHIRDMVTFAPQNLLHDPPFSRLDLVSCRNLLIYLEPEAQKKVIVLLHFALREGGFLFLGTTESVGEQEQLFKPVSKKWSIYCRIGPTRHDIVDFPVIGLQGKHNYEDLLHHAPRRKPGFSDLAQKVLAARYAPASVLIDGKHQILYFHGPTERYLAQPAGEPTRDLLSMLSKRLTTKVRIAMRGALTENRSVTVRSAPVKQGDQSQTVAVTVTPLADPETEGLLLVSFEEEIEPAASAPAVQESPEATTVERQLEQMLQQIRQELSSTVEELEIANEELKATNEEITSMNEELQSTNEELQASKEELQSLNEELNTMNAQLQNKVGQLEQVNNDLINLINSTQIATVFLDTRLRIKWFTPAIKDLLDMLSSDVGRPIQHFAQKFAGGDLISGAETVMEKLQPIQSEVQSDDGRWYILRILPYRTQDNRIEGVVVTFTDITERKRDQDAINQARLYAESIVETIRQPLLVLNGDLRIESANRAFYSGFEVSAGETKGRLIYELGERQWDIPRLRTLLEEIIPQNSLFNDFEVEHEFDNIGWRHMLLNARRLDHESMILLAIEDVTERKQGEKALIALTQELEERVRKRTAQAEQRAMQLQALTTKLITVEQRERRRLALVLHDHLQQFLVAAMSRLSLSRKEEAKGKDPGPSLQAVSRLLDQALDASRSLTVELSPLILHEGGLATTLNWLVRWNKENHGLTVELDIDRKAETLNEGLGVFIFHSVRELLLNVVKHSGVDQARVEITRQDGDQLRVAVSDGGKGIDPKLKPRDEPTKHFGLFSLRERLGIMGGQLEIDGAPGKGTRVTMILPAGLSEDKAEQAE
ncbi:MAG: chemotaxis protein CheB [Acidobacteriota bacterium]